MSASTTKSAKKDGPRIIRANPWTPVRKSKAGSAKLFAMFGEHIDANYDEFTKKEDSSFESLGKSHVEIGKFPTKRLPPTMPDIRGGFDFDSLIPPPPTTTVLSVPGEELYNSVDEDERKMFVDGVIGALVKYGRLFIEGAAGTGKSSVVKAIIDRFPEWKYVVLNPYGSLIAKVWGGYDAMTDAKALGKIVDDQGELEQTTAGLDFSTLQLLVVDEAYLLQLDAVYALERRMKANPMMRVIYLGCEYQNDSIVRQRENSVLVKPIADILAEVFSRILPHRVVLRINKRSPQDQPKLEAIHRMLFEEGVAPNEVVRYIVANKWIGGVIGDDDQSIISSGITRHICYLNCGAIRLNKLVHCGIYKQQYKFEVADGTHILRKNVVAQSKNNYFVGRRCRVVEETETSLRLSFLHPSGSSTEDAISKIAIRSLSGYSGGSLVNFLLQPVGEYVLREYNKGLVRNTSIFLSTLPSAPQKKKAYGFRQSMKAVIKDAVSITAEKVNFKSIRLPYATTGHSSQGETIHEKYCIHDVGVKHMSPKWLWTVLTRGTRLSNVFVRREKEEESSSASRHKREDFLRFSADKLSLYVVGDKKTGREAAPAQYDVERMADMAEKAYGRRCEGVFGEACVNVMDLVNNEAESISFDRINNSIVHSIDNLRCVCLACNVQAQDRGDKTRVL